MAFVSVLPQRVHTATLLARSLPYMREGGLQVPPEALLSHKYHTTQPVIPELENVARSALRTALPQALATHEHGLGEAEPFRVELESRGGAAGIERKGHLLEDGKVEFTGESFEAFDMPPGSTTFAVTPLARKRRRLLIVGSRVAHPFAARGLRLLRCRHPYHWGR